jgi:hypothetical protein
VAIQLDRRLPALPEDQTLAVIPGQWGIGWQYGLEQGDGQGVSFLWNAGEQHALVGGSRGRGRCGWCGRRGRGPPGAGSRENQGDEAGPQDPATTNGLPPSLALIRAAAAWASTRVAKPPARTL